MKFLALSMSAVALFSFASCGGGTDPESSTRPSESAAAVFDPSDPTAPSQTQDETAGETPSLTGGGNQLQSGSGGTGDGNAPGGNTAGGSGISGGDSPGGGNNSPGGAGGTDSTPTFDNTRLRIASYNTAAPWGSFWQGTASGTRVKLFAEELKALAPDSMGVQEINSDWVGKLAESAPGYAYYGVKRGGDKNEKESEMSGIFYLKDKYDLLESDTFWISETPDVMSKYPGAGCNRVCSYVVLKNKQTGFTYAHLNTHLDNASEDARILGGKLVAQKAQDLNKKYGGSLTTIVTGDFNQYLTSTACAPLLDAGYKSASAVNPNAENMPTYHGWGEYTSGHPIDFIFYGGALRAQSFTIHNQKTGSSYTSDHWCISADFSIQE